MSSFIGQDTDTPCPLPPPPQQEENTVGSTSHLVLTVQFNPAPLPSKSFLMDSIAT